ncbi:WD40 repeat domain-containing protein [Micromonospora sp. M71_S20]|uniref:WD40 repeat domain-containing protein n=1 Tax=Micromonospora sp. M71_S20 TaxID=592872 RepID=UPI0018F54DDF|nr:hypothetical protein [Micromonospora sp. M71_S20]
MSGAGIRRVVCGLVDGRRVALTLGDHSFQVWSMDDHQQMGDPFTVPDVGSVWGGIAYGVMRERPVAVVVGGGLRVWDLVERRQLSHTSVNLGLCDVACTQLNGELIAVTGGYDQTVQVWHAATGRRLSGPMRGHTSVIRSVACGAMHGRPIAVTASEDHTVRIWDLDRCQQIGQPLRGHDSEVEAVAYGVLGSRPIAVSGGRDGTVRLWNLDDPDRPAATLVGHDSRVHAVALAKVSGQIVAISGGKDVRVWDVRRRLQLGPPLFDGRDIGIISSIACGTRHGGTIVLAASASERVRVWDLNVHRDLGSVTPDRYASELPTSWTDPTTGDVYDLTCELVDAYGSTWELVDYDGTEPIVCEHPLDPRVTFGIADAHAEYDFGDIVTPKDRRHRSTSRRLDDEDDWFDGDDL